MAPAGWRRELALCLNRSHQALQLCEHLCQNHMPFQEVLKGPNCNWWAITGFPLGVGRLSLWRGWRRLAFRGLLQPVLTCQDLTEHGTILGSMSGRASGPCQPAAAPGDLALGIPGSLLLANQFLPPRIFLLQIEISRSCP